MGIAHGPTQLNIISMQLARSELGFGLPAKMRKGLIGFGHFMGVFLFLNGSASIVGSIQ
jgi:hypothetical protein